MPLKRRMGLLRMLPVIPLALAVATAKDKPKVLAANGQPARYVIASIPLEEMLALNNRGDIAGTHFENKDENGRPVATAAIYRDGKVVDIGPGRVLALNDLGQVLVAPYFTGVTFWPYIWKDGKQTLLPDGFWPTGMNNRGEVAGNRDGKPAIWRDGKLKDLPGLPVPACYAHLINNRGEVVLGWQDPETWVRWLWLWRGGKTRRLGNDGESLYPYEVMTDNGDIAGTLAINDSEWAAVCHRDRLERLPMPEGADHAGAIGLISPGGVVGYSQTSLSDEATDYLSYLRSIRARLWKDGKVYDLNELIPADSGWELLMAERINDRGQIIGYGVWNDEDHSFLLTPVR